MATIKVRMKSGGYMNLEVEGRCYKDSNGAGERWLEVEIDSIKWPHGGEVNSKNIADIGEVKQKFADTFDPY